MKNQILPYPFTTVTTDSVEGFKPIILFDEQTQNANQIKQETPVKTEVAVDSAITIKEVSSLDSITAFNTTIKISEGLDSFSSPKQETYTEQPAKEKVFVIQYNKINDTTNNWMFWVVLGSLVLFGWVRLLYRKQLSLILTSALNYNFALKSIRNNNEFSDRFSFLLTLIFILNLGLFAFQTTSIYSGINLQGLQSAGITLSVSVGILALYFVKEFLIKLLGYIFQQIEYAQEYTYNINLYNKILGLFMFPVIISLAFVKEGIINHQTLIKIGFGLILIFFILRIIRGIQISIRSNVSILYMFLYFCTLEVLPILILVKTGVIISKLF